MGHRQWATASGPGALYLTSTPSWSRLTFLFVVAPSWSAAHQPAEQLLRHYLWRGHLLVRRSMLDLRPNQSSSSRFKRARLRNRDAEDFVWFGGLFSHVCALSPARSACNHLRAKQRGAGNSHHIYCASHPCRRHQIPMQPRAQLTLISNFDARPAFLSLPQNTQHNHHSFTPRMRSSSFSRVIALALSLCLVFLCTMTTASSGCLAGKELDADEISCVTCAAGKWSAADAYCSTHPAAVAVLPPPPRASTMSAAAALPPPPRASSRSAAAASTGGTAGGAQLPPAASRSKRGADVPLAGAPASKHAGAAPRKGSAAAKAAAAAAEAAAAAAAASEEEGDEGGMPGAAPDDVPGAGDGTGAGATSMDVEQLLEELDKAGAATAALRAQLATALALGGEQLHASAARPAAPPAPRSGHEHESTSAVGLSCSSSASTAFGISGVETASIVRCKARNSWKIPQSVVVDIRGMW